MAEAESDRKQHKKSKSSPPPVADYKEGEEVEALYRGEWYPCMIVKTGPNLVHVIYKGFETDGDYPVGFSDVRRIGENKAKPRDWDGPPLSEKPTAWATELEIKREPGLPDTFFASIPGPPIMDRMTNLGIYAIPTVGFYPYITQFEIQPKCIIEAPGDHIRLPKEIYDEFVERRINDFQYFFVVNDVSQVIHKQKNKKPMNLINHTWIHPMIEMGAKLGYGPKSQWWFGCYSYEQSGVGPVPQKCDLSVQMLTKYDVHIHPQKGGMCLSPNNCKFMVDRNYPVSSFWTVAVEQTEGKPRCSVTLHWLLNERWPELDDFFGNAGTVSDLLGFFSNMVEGSSSPNLLALLYNFGFVEIWPFKPAEKCEKRPPKQKDKNNKNDKGKIQCERCGRMLGGNLEAHQQGKKCREAWAKKQVETSQEDTDIQSRMFF